MIDVTFTRETPESVNAAVTANTVQGAYFLAGFTDDIQFIDNFKNASFKALVDAPFSEPNVWTVEPIVVGPRRHRKMLAALTGNGLHYVTFI